MNADLVKELMTRLDAIGDKIGKGAGYIFPLAIRQVYIDAFVIFAATIMIMVATAIFIKMALLYHKTVEDSDNLSRLERDKYEMLYITFTVSSIFGAVLLMLFIMISLYQLSYILNPEYAALKSLLNTVK